MIEVQQLTYIYPSSRKPAIQDIELSIGKGEIFGLLGPSGAGKSTTQKVLTGIAKQYKGSVRVFGEEMSHAKRAYYERIGVAFEFPNFYTRFTALENLKLFRSLYSVPTVDPVQLLKQVGLEDAANMRVSDYSKGMKMRLNFIRALLNQPELLFLDEPTSGLDPVNSKLMRELILQKKAEGTTVLINTHNMHVAEEICDRVAFVVDGRIALIDSPRELKLRKGKKSLKVEYRREGETRTVEFPLEGLGRNEAFQTLLRSEDIETIHSQETTLEQIFVDVTGRSLA